MKVDRVETPSSMTLGRELIDIRRSNAEDADKPCARHDQHAHSQVAIREIEFIQRYNGIWDEYSLKN